MNPRNGLLLPWKLFKYVPIRTSSSLFRHFVPILPLTSKCVHGAFAGIHNLLMVLLYGLLLLFSVVANFIFILRQLGMVLSVILIT